MELTILTNISGYLKDIEEQKVIWINNLLNKMGLDLSKFIAKDGKILPEFFSSNDLKILTYAGTNLIKVYKGLELVGEFFEPEFKMKKDESGSMYYEIKIKTKDVFEE